MHRHHRPSPRHSLAILVANLEARAPLDEGDRAALLSLPHSRRTMSPSAYIVRDGEVPGPCAVLLSGFAYRQKVTSDGARQIVSIHLPGEMLDLQHLHLDCADHSVQALTEVEIAYVPRQTLREVMAERPGIGRAVGVASAVEASIAREWMLNIGRRDARTRLAHLLCEFAMRLERLDLSGDYGYELPVTQEWLGDALGLTPVHVNRMIRALAEEGLIARHHRAIRFPDWPAMRDVAGFSEQYLHFGAQVAV